MNIILFEYVTQVEISKMKQNKQSNSDYYLINKL